MPDYKLIYFNGEGRAELIRWCFAYGGISYIDERVEQNDWPQRKKELGGGSLPILMVDGKPLTESLAIARYVAKQAGLVPKDDLQAAHCDALIDSTIGLIVDIWQKVVFSKEEPAEKQRLLNEELVPNKINPVLNRLNEILSNRDWFISEQVTVADLQISWIFSSIARHVPSLLKNYPNVTKVVDNVQALTSMKKWLSTRPKSPF